IRDLTVTGVQTCALPICDRASEGDVVREIHDAHAAAADLPLNGVPAGKVLTKIGQRLAGREERAHRDLMYGINIQTAAPAETTIDRKSTRLNSSHSQISY